MKKILSVLLCIVIVFSSLTVFSFAKEKESDLNFAVASDIHVVLPEEELEKTNDDPIFWYANRRAAMDNESSFIFESFLSQCAADDDIEFVLIAGDLTENGKVWAHEHARVAELLFDFEKTSGKQVYVINGNHDIYEFTKDDFKNTYFQFGYDNALETREDDCSYTADLGDKYRLIALDSCDYNVSTADGMTESKIKWTINQAEKAYADGRYPILMMHHNLLEHMPLQTIISKNFIVKNHSLTAERFANAGIKLVFTGHEHCSDATTYTSVLGNEITDFANTALSMYPLSYRVFSLTDTEISYEAKFVESIDTDTLKTVTDGYTDEMLDAMNEDLNAFAKGYLKEGVKYRLRRGFTPEKLGVKESDIYYDLVMGVVNTLDGTLMMPLYGEENSVEALAKSYNIALPQSDYKNGWDLATELVSWHYAGSEPFAIDSPEVVILLRTVALLLKEEVSVINDELFFKLGNIILENLGLKNKTDEIESLIKKTFGGITPIGYFTAALLSPLLYGFANDCDDTDDNNGTLMGYAVDNSSENIKKSFVNIFIDLIENIKLFFTVISRMFSSFVK